MEGASWADQWDTSNSEPAGGNRGRLVAGNHTAGKPSAAGKYKQKIGEGFEKTKSVASTGFKKMKHGTAVGFNWVKDKYHKKTTQKH